MSLRIRFLYCLLFSLTLPAWAQKETNRWYFGLHGGLDFNTNPPTVLSDGKIDTYFYGSASISDADGNFLFYTDGTTVWNRNQQIMANGNDLRGKAGFRSTETLVVPKPGSKGLYYVFVLNPYYYAATDGLSYSVVDMNRQGGLGEVLTKTFPLVMPCVMKLTAVRHANGRDVWVIAHQFRTQAFYAYLVTEAGVNATPVVSTVGANQEEEAGGQLNASPDGSQVAITVEESVRDGFRRATSSVEVFDFNNCTGKLSNPLVIPDPDHNEYSADSYFYGVSFSPNGNLLYVTGYNTSINFIFQYNLRAGTAAQIIQSRQQINDGNDNLLGQLQLGPDGRIYLGNGGSSSSNYLSTINKPDLPGNQCDYQKLSIKLNGSDPLIQMSVGLPNFIQSYFQPPPAILLQEDCLGKPTLFSATGLGRPDSLQWNFDDAVNGPTNRSTQELPTHLFSQPGNHTVRLTSYRCGIPQTLSKVITIQTAPRPDLGKDTLLCSGSSLTLDAGVWKSYRWSGGESTRFASIRQSGTVWVEVGDGHCLNRDSIQVTFLPTPVADLGPDRQLCDRVPVALQAGNLGATYRWSTGAVSPAITVQATGIYWVEIRRGACVDRDTVAVAYDGVYDLVAAAAPAMITNQEPIQFTAQATGIKAWAWDFGDGETSPVQNPAHSYAQEGEYTAVVRATNEAGCTAVDSLRIRVMSYLYIPNVFTPNGDGSNDNFHIQYNGKETYALTVYNRWGEAVFASDNRKTLWNGAGYDPGLYYFLLRVGGQPYQGWVQLLR